MSPETRLAVRVIDRTIRDYCGTTTGNKEENRRARRDAQYCLFDDSSKFVVWCSIAGVTLEATREAAREAKKHHYRNVIDRLKKYRTGHETPHGDWLDGNTKFGTQVASAYKKVVPERLRSHLSDYCRTPARPGPKLAYGE
jgi:hypothetical protein